MIKKNAYNRGSIEVNDRNLEMSLKYKKDGKKMS